VHRVLTATAAASLLAGLREIWIRTTTDSAGLGLVLTLCYAAVLALVVLALCSTRRRALIRIDVAVLLVAVAIEVVQLHRFVAGTFTYSGDEGILSAHAMDVLRHGHDPYRFAWPRAVAQAPTQLMGGGVADRFSYPPLAAVLGAGAGLISPALASPAFITGLALIATAVFMFAVFPASLRPLAVLVVFGIAFETSRAIAGEPGVVAVPFLAVALWRWPTTGMGGRLDRSSLIRAGALGLAMATWQLAWFVVPFLAVGLWRLRRGELPHRAALLTVGGYLGVAIGAFAVVNAPFAAIGFTDWWDTVTSVFTQHALLYGPGIAMISGNVLPGSGALDFYSYAAALFYLALLVALAFAPQRLGPAIPVLAMVSFWLAIRSEDTYYVVFAPLWILAAVTVGRADFSAARAMSMPAWLQRRRTKLIAAAALCTPAIACVVVALATPSPLTMAVVSTSASPTHQLAQIDVSVHNRSDRVVQPHFVLLADAQLGVFWRVRQGPAQLAPGQHATYQLLAPGRGFQPPSGVRVQLDAVSDHPQTLSAVKLPSSS
jgi:hypothetical protein